MDRTASEDLGRAKKVKREEEDIISNLPKSILTQILSKLPTKDAVRTSILSRNWEYKWTCIECMDLTDNWTETRQRTQKGKFVNFVERVLLLCESPKIKEFYIEYHCARDNRYLKQWIYAVLKRGVEKLKFYFDGLKPEDFVFPSWFFNCSSLKELKIVVSGTIKVPTVMCFPNLRILELYNIRFLGEMNSPHSQLLFDLPALEVLDLSSCEWLNITRTKIDAPALVDFKICWPDANLNENAVEICGPCIVNFTYSISQLDQFVLHKPLPVPHATLKYFSHRDENLQSISELGFKAGSFLATLLSVRYLNISSDIVWALVLKRPVDCLSMFDTIIHLKISRLESPFCLSTQVLIEFLHFLPNLEKVVFEQLRLVYDLPPAAERWPLCFRSALKVVKFISYFGKHDDVLMVKLVLKHAASLQELSICLHESAKADKASIEQKLLAFSRGSSIVSLAVSA